MKCYLAIKNYLMVVVGSIMFSLALNIFIVPHGLYNGGFVGIAQIITTLIQENMNIVIDFNIAGIINFVMNIPLFLLTYKVLSKRFFIGSFLSIVTITIFMALIPISTIPLLSDVLASCIIGGIVGGLGIGLTLLSGASGGGLDIVGVYTTMKYKDFSVGKLQLSINLLIYLACAILFDIQIAIYSIIYQVVFSLIVDKIHYQNIEISVMIFTKNKEVKHRINSDLRRGVTFWRGMGAYTNDETDVLITIVSKYEISRLKKIVLELDSKAFLVISNGVHVTGGYEKRLV